jgi:hypothetical protein
VGWLRVDARVVRDDDANFEHVGAARSTVCLVALADQLDARARAAG